MGETREIVVDKEIEWKRQQVTNETTPEMERYVEVLERKDNFQETTLEMKKHVEVPERGRGQREERRGEEREREKFTGSHDSVGSQLHRTNLTFC